MSDLVLFSALFGGLIILAVSGDLLVTGAVSLARQFNVSPLMTGILIVGFGTSMPEMIVAVNAVLEDSPALAVGNIVGSNISNIWLVLAIPAFLASVQTGGFGQARGLAFMLLATAVWIGLTAISPLNVLTGLALVSGLVVYIVATIRQARAAERAGLTLEFDETAVDAWKPVPFILIGIVGLPVGASLIVEGGVGIARAYQISEEIIGLTLLAVGTSLPEIGAAISAALRGRPEVVVGSVLGSNVFNLLAAGGLISFFGPVEVALGFKQYDYWAMALAALTLALYIVPKAKVSRMAGLSMMLIYMVYLYGLVSGWNILGGVKAFVS
ncbi:MAG: calcium/sodium antiporter [Pseudomonadota bacterium]